MKPPRPISRLDKSKSKSRAKMALNFLFQQTHCNILPQIRMIHVPTTCDGVLASCPTSRVTHFVMHLRLRLLSNCNTVTVCCHSVAFGRRYVPALCACLLLLLLLLLPFCLLVDLTASTAKSPFTSFFQHPFHPPFTVQHPLVQHPLHTRNWTLQHLLFSSPSCNSLRTHAHTHYAPDSVSFSSISPL